MYRSRRDRAAPCGCVSSTPIVSVGQLSLVIVLAALVLSVSAKEQERFTTRAGAKQGVLRLAVWIAGACALGAGLTLTG